MITELLGYIAAIFTTTSFIPQAIRVYKTNDTKAISLKMYVLFVSGVFLWLIYGIMSEQYPIIIANVFTFIFAGLVLFKKIREKTNSQT